MGRVADEYFKEQGINIPPLLQENYGKNKEIDGVLIKDRGAMWDLKIADVQFGSNVSERGMCHLAFRSWLGDATHAKCFDKPKTIEPFFDYFCAHPQNRATLIK